MTKISPMAFEPRAAVESYVVGVDWPAEIVTTIVSSQWSVVPDDGTLTLSNAAFSGLQTSVRVTGGTPGTAYALRNVVAVTGPSGADIYAVSVRQDVTW